MRTRATTSAILKIIAMILIGGVSQSAMARSYSLKIVGSGGYGGENNYLWFQDKSKHVVAELSIGGPSQRDDLSPLEIRAASVFKDIKTRKAFINDVAKEAFTSTNSATSKIIIVSGAAGKRVDRDAKVNGGYDFSHGNTVAGIIVEIWQNGKCIKHLSNLSGKDGKTQLKDGIPEFLLSATDIWDSSRKILSAQEIAEKKANGFDNATLIKIP